MFYKKTTYIKRIVLLLCCSVLLSNCKRKPVADFTLDKEVYNAGDVVMVTNESTLADYYYLSYFDTDGNEIQNPANYYFTNASENKVQSIKLSSTAKEGIYRVCLKATGAKPGKTSTCNKIFEVTSLLGPVTITAKPRTLHQHSGSYSWSDFRVDGEPLSKFGYRTAANNIIEYMLPVGLRKISARCDGPFFPPPAGSIYVRADQVTEVHFE
ncbi:MAG: hypothetical protein V4635_07210 [Bacteroidota bacterium]